MKDDIKFDMDAAITGCSKLCVKVAFTGDHRALMWLLIAAINSTC